MYLSLKGKAREAVRILKPEDIGTRDGYNLVIAMLDGVYLKDETTLALCIKRFLWVTIISRQVIKI